MKVSEIRSLSDDELKQKDGELSREYFNLRFQHASGQLENTSTMPRTKKDIAKIRTVLRERRK